MQIVEWVICEGVCCHCVSVRPTRDRRMRVLPILFGTVRVAAPRIKLRTCVDKGPFYDVSFSPLSDQKSV